MPYLTYEEYKGFGYEEIEQNEFNKLLPRASDILDFVTRNFYHFNDLEKDIEFRRMKFKKAIAAQIAYFNDIGGTMSHEMTDFNHVQIGRTSMSKGGRQSSTSSSDDKNSVVSEDVYIILSGTGLLYRGIGVC